jgi:hypothetical protein
MVRWSLNQSVDLVWKVLQAPSLVQDHPEPQGVEVEGAQQTLFTFSSALFEILTFR